MAYSLFVWFLQSNLVRKANTQNLLDSRYKEQSKATLCLCQALDLGLVGYNSSHHLELSCQSLCSSQFWLRTTHSKPCNQFYQVNEDSRIWNLSCQNIIFSRQN